MASKLDRYQEIVVDGKRKFECLLCARRVSSKHYTLQHLVSAHNCSPLKRVKKLYVDDSSIQVPERTVRRWKKNKTDTNTASVSCNELLDDELVHEYNHDTNLCCSSNDGAYQNKYNIEVGSVASSSECKPSISEFRIQVPLSDSELENDSSAVSYCDNLMTENSSVSNDSLDDSIILSSYSDSEESLMSDTSSSSAFTDDSTDNTEDVSVEQNTSLSENEQQALKILSCFQRHHLSKSACKDILETMKTAIPGSEHEHLLDFDYIHSFVDKQAFREIHYCEFCYSIFPADLNLFKCDSENCTGLRYKGSLSYPQGRDRQPRKYFIISDIKKQLSHLLQTSGILSDIEKCKSALEHSDSSNTLKDITDGSFYRNMLNTENGFLKDHPYNLTAIMNTDGVNLYSSSKVELWPVFLAINELSPKVRFSRDNMLLIGIWQGKGKPPFRQLFDAIAEELNSLYNEGVEVEVKNEVIMCRLAVICGVFDLPAKANVLNMTFYNGENACITCEEPGVSVKQGKGTARCYPFRKADSRYPMRKSEDLVEPMHNATDKKRIKGFRGISCLALLQSYDLVQGTVPDYMHGILLGITKTLLFKWFSPTQSDKPYFIGKHIKTVCKRLSNIKPPACIERLPRDLEKHYQNLKATELQAWLLFYWFPCLSGILPRTYLRHFACLSEAVYILLGDGISPDMLDRAQFLLNHFYADFEESYGRGSCGLNVHNACLHLVWYVQLHGPLWAWSCFPFEDANAMLLKSVHGTGNVMKQILLYKGTDSSLRKKGVSSVDSTLWKVTRKTNNCEICGNLKPVTSSDIAGEVLNQLGINGTSDLKKVKRVSCAGKQFCSMEYTRMKKRTCYMVLYDNNKVGSLQYFILDESINTVFAVVKCYDKHVDTELEQLDAGKHIVSVRTANDLDVVPVELLIDTLININVGLSLAESYVVLMPNVHGHAIFK